MMILNHCYNSRHMHWKGVNAMNRKMSNTHKKSGSNKGILLVLLLLICLSISSFYIINNQGTNVTIYPPNPIETNIPDRKPVTKPTNSTSPIDSTSKTNPKAEVDWSLTLVNRWNPIQTFDTIEVLELSNGQRVDKRIYPYLQKMFDAARHNGVYPIVVSGYRTEQEQEDLYNAKIADYQSEGLSAADAKREAEKWVAIPGTSEHQLGLAVDINADGVRSKGPEVYDWLEANAHLYGFLYRYPKNKIDLTGVANEPWHYRFVGVKAATEIY